MHMVVGFYCITTKRFGSFAFINSFVEYMLTFSVYCNL